MSGTARFSGLCHCINTRRAANAITEFYDRLLKPCGLSVSQFSLLLNLERLGEANASRLARYVGLERSTIVRNIKQLARNNLVEDAPGSTSRNHLTRVTDTGKAAVQCGLPLWEQAQQEIDARVGSERLEVFQDILKRLQQL